MMGDFNDSKTTITKYKPLLNNKTHTVRLKHNKTKKARKTLKCVVGTKQVINTKILATPEIMC